MFKKAYKFRLQPNKNQRILINKTIGCCRLIYNCMLYEKQNAYENEIENFIPKTEKDYKQEKDFLKEVDSIALQQSRIDLTTSYKNHFRKLKKKEKTSLRYKSKKNVKNSYRTININNSIRTESNRIRIPKLGFVRFKKSREINGNIKSITVSKNILNQYHISILVDEEINKLPESKNNIGIDLGLKDFAICSNGNIVDNPRYYREYENKLAKEQRKLSHRDKASNRYEKQRKKVFRIHQKIRNIREDFLQKLSSKIINENQVICLEDLNVKGMVKNPKLSKSISDVSWSSFVRMLEYKSDWYGRTIIKIDRFFPSSKLCNNCNYKNNDLELKDRYWDCPSCGKHLDRDMNASFNILDEGLRLYKNRRDGGDSSIMKEALAS